MIMTTIAVHLNTWKSPWQSEKKRKWTKQQSERTK